MRHSNHQRKTNVRLYACALFTCIHRWLIWLKIVVKIDKIRYDLTKSRACVIIRYLHICLGILFLALSVDFQPGAYLENRKIL